MEWSAKEGDVGVTSLLPSSSTVLTKERAYIGREQAGQEQSLVLRENASFVEKSFY